MLVVVADSLQLAAARQLPGDKLQAPPQTFTVEEDEELGHHSGGDEMRKIYIGIDRYRYMYVGIDIYI